MPHALLTIVFPRNLRYLLLAVSLILALSGAADARGLGVDPNGEP